MKLYNPVNVNSMNSSINEKVKKEREIITKVGISAQYSAQLAYALQWL